MEDCYQLPDIEQLNNSITILSGDANLAKQKLISFIKKINTFTNNFQGKEAAQINAGCILYVLKKMDKKNGWFFQSDDPLATKLLTILNIKNLKQISLKKQLIYIEALYENFNKFECDELTDFEHTRHDVLKEIDTLWKMLLEALHIDIKKKLKVLPGLALNYDKMAHLYDNYLKTKTLNKKGMKNTERIFNAQLGQALGTMLTEGLQEIPSHLDKTIRGMALFIIYTIKTEWVRKSDLSDLCFEALGVKKLDEIDNDEQLKAILCLKNYLHNNQNLEAIENFGEKNFINNQLIHIYQRLNKIEKQLEEINEQLLKNQSPAVYATYILSAIGAFLGATTTYGMGAVLGSALSQANESIASKMFINTVLQQIGTKYLGAVGGPYGLLAAELLVGSILSRTFAKTFEFAGVWIGNKTGNAIGYTFDSAVHGVRNACNYLYELYNKQPDISSYLDDEFMLCLHHLPPEIFSDANKERLEHDMRESASNVMKLSQA